MKVVLLIILVILALAVGLLTAATWYKWQIFIHFKDNRLFIELKGLFFKRVLVDRDFSQKEDGEKKTDKADVKEEKKAEDEKPSGLSERFKADKERIYTKESGYNHQGLKDVVEEYKGILEQIKGALNIFFSGMRYKIEIPLIRIKLDFGTGNPAHTGMLFGGVWGVVGTAYPIARRYIDVAYPVMEVTPDFNGERFDIEVKSIIKVRPAHIINALLKREIWAAVTYCYKNIIKGSVENG